VTGLALNRLNRREGLVPVQAFAGNAALPDEIMTEVFERADGVPLFVEELTPTGHWSATRCFPLKATLFGRPSTDNGRPTYRDGSGNAADRSKSLHCFAWCPDEASLQFEKEAEVAALAIRRPTVASARDGSVP
jgi:hypothetical protein